MARKVRALVTGVTGFVGCSVARRLIDDGADVYGLVRSRSEQKHRLERVPEMSILELDEFDPPTLGSALATVRPEYVFHLASTGVVPAGETFDEVVSGNVGLVLDLLRALPREPLRRVLLTGSCFEYGPCSEREPLSESRPTEPLSPYGAAKLAAHHLSRAYCVAEGLPAVTLRLFGTYGPDEAPRRLVPSLIRHLDEGAPLALTPGEQVRDLLFVEDVAEAYWRAARATGLARRGVYNLCSGEAITVREVGEMVRRIMGRPAEMLKWGELPYRENESMWILGDPARFRSCVDWRPRHTMLAGLEKTVRQLLERRDRERKRPA